MRDCDHQDEGRIKKIKEKNLKWSGVAVEISTALHWVQSGELQISRILELLEFSTALLSKHELLLFAATCFSFSLVEICYIRCIPKNLNL